MTNSYSFDTDPHEGLAFHILAMALFQQYGTALIPYVDVARELMGWKTEKTAKANLNKLVDEGLVIVRFEFGTANTFVLVQDLARFIMAKRTVTISSTKRHIAVEANQINML